MRDENRRSKGRKDGVGLLSPGRDATDGRMLLPTDDLTDPYNIKLAIIYLPHDDVWFPYLN